MQTISVKPLSKSLYCKKFEDIIYKYVEVSQLALTFIDTEEFQRLRGIRQLGFSHFVFPSAHHTRFEHMIGCYHLVHRVLQFLKQNQPDLKELNNDRLCELVKLGALLHDIGHGPFSHPFDQYLLPQGCPEHEERSVQLVEKMVKKYNIALESNEIEFIQHVILGKQFKDFPEYLFQIVANHACEVDIDKFDYIVRDSFYCNMHTGFQQDYLLHNIRVIDNQLCFRENQKDNIWQLFIARAKLTREIYKHHANLKYCVLIERILKEAKQFIDMKQCLEDDTWLTWNDESFLMFIKQRAPKDHIIHQLVKRFYTRKLPCLILQSNTPPRCSTPLLQQTNPQQQTNSRFFNPMFKVLSEGKIEKNTYDQTMDDQLLNESMNDSMNQTSRIDSDNNLIVRIGFCNNRHFKNPVYSVWFYKGSNPDYKYHLKQDSFSIMLPQEFEEYLHYKIEWNDD